MGGSSNGAETMEHGTSCVYKQAVNSETPSLALNSCLPHLAAALIKQALSYYKLYPEELGCKQD